MIVSMPWPALVFFGVIIFIAGAISFWLLGSFTGKQNVTDLRLDQCDWLFARVLDRLGRARDEINAPLSVRVDVNQRLAELDGKEKRTLQQIEIAIGLCACYARGAIVYDPTKADDDVERWQVVEWIGKECNQ